MEAFSAVEPAGSAPAFCVLYFGGNEDRVNPWTAGVARMWHEQTGLPVEVVGVNLPGFGLSTGPARLKRLGPAGLAAYDALRARRGGTPIVLQAASLGTTAALCIAANRPVAALTIHDAPALRQLVREYRGRGLLWPLAALAAMTIPADIDAIANAGRIKAPCVFITSGSDTVIPPPFQERIVEAYAGPHEHVIIPGGRHCAQPDAATGARLAELRRWLLEKAGIELPKGGVTEERAIRGSGNR